MHHYIFSTLAPCKLRNGAITANHRTWLTMTWLQNWIWRKWCWFNVFSCIKRLNNRTNGCLLFLKKKTHKCVLKITIGHVLTACRDLKLLQEKGQRNTKRHFSEDHNVQSSTDQSLNRFKFKILAFEFDFRCCNHWWTGWRVILLSAFPNQGFNLNFNMMKNFFKLG